MLRSVAEQSTAELGGRLSVLTRQKNDHVELDRLLNRLGETQGSDQEGVLLSIYRLVFPHAFAEEAVLWPVMRRVLPDGHDLTLEVEQEHQEVNELVAQLDRLSRVGEQQRSGRDADQREALLQRLTDVLRDDVRDEEDELFPRLQDRLSPAQLRWLGLAWEVLRRTAPTRAHPVVARRPPGNVLAAVPLSVTDRLRDLADYGALRSSSRTGTTALKSVSDALGRAADRIEHLPIMRRGEDPSTHLPVHVGT